VNEEKRTKYLSYTEGFCQKYGIDNWDVNGLWFDARGLASSYFVKFSNSLYWVQSVKDMFVSVKRHLSRQ